MRNLPGERWVPLLLVLALGAHAGATLYWIHLDQAVGRPAVAEMLWHVSALVQAEAQGRLAELARDFHSGWVIWAALGLRHILGTHPDCLLWLVLVFMIGAQLALFDLGRRLGGPWAGLAIAVLFPLYPDVAVMLRRWTPHTFHYFCLAAAAACLVRSRSFNRPVATAGFVAFAALGVGASPMSTDNMTYLPAVGAMALGAGLRGLFLGWGPCSGEPVSRWKTLLLGALAAGVLGLVVWHNGMFQQDVGYIQSEMASARFEHHYQRWSVPALTAYVRYLYHLGVSPVLCIPFVVALVPYLRRGAARAEMVAWLVVPLVAFSLVGKKHPNYVFAVLPVFPVVTVLGLVALKRRGVGGVLLGFVIVVAGIQWVNRAFPAPDRPLARYLGPYDIVPDLGRAFEFEFVPNLEPITSFRHAREARLLYPRMSELACRPSNLVQVLYPGDFQDVRFILTAKNPCVDIVAWPDVSRLEVARWVLVADENCRLLEEGVGGTRDTGSGERGDTASGDVPPWATAGRRVATAGRHLLLARDVTVRPCLYLFARRPGR